MTLAKIAPKKFTYSIKELWDISGFASKFEHFISPVALGLILAGIPSLFVQEQDNRAIGYGLLVVFCLYRFYKFIFIFSYIKRSGKDYEIEFSPTNIKVKKTDKSIVTIPYSSLKQYRITSRILTASTLKTGVSIPIRVLTSEEERTISLFFKNNLDKNYSPSIWKKILVLLSVLILGIALNIASFFLRGYITFFG